MVTTLSQRERERELEKIRGKKRAPKRAKAVSELHDEFRELIGYADRAHGTARKRAVDQINAHIDRWPYMVQTLREHASPELRKEVAAAVRAGKARKAKGPAPLTGQRRQVMAILKVAHDDRSAGGAHFAIPKEKRALKQLVAEGYARIVREGRMGRGQELYGLPTPAGLEAYRKVTT